MAEERVTYNPCQGWGCHEICILETHTVDGKIVRTQKSTLPGFIGTRCQICQKGISSWKVPYNDERLLYPLKRVGERGEGKFEQISWDQALDEICDKLKEITEKYGHEAIMTNPFYCGTPGNRGSLTDILAIRFSNLYGCSRVEYEGVDYSGVQAEFTDLGTSLMAGRDMFQNATDVIVIWGGNPIGFTRPARSTRQFLDAKERGVKIVNVSNGFDNTSAFADMWIPVKSGTDGAFASAVAHVIVRDNMVDEEFMKMETVAPILINEENGLYLRESDVKEGGSNELFGIFDTKTNQVAFIPHQDQRMSGFGEYDPDMKAEGEIDGIAYKTAYRKLEEFLADWTPERQEPITGVPAATVEEFAHLYGESPAVLLCVGNGMRYGNGMQSDRAIKLLAYLTGNFGRPNGATSMTAGTDVGIQAGFSKNPFLSDPAFDPNGITLPSTSELLASFENPDGQQYKAFINPEGNPLLNWPNKDLWTKQILPNFELFVAIEIRMSDTCRWADYVLPETTAFERYEFITDTDNTAVLCEPAIEPLGEARNAADIWRGFAERLGIGEYFQKTQEEWIRALVEETGQRGGGSIWVYPEVTDGGATGYETPELLTYDMIKEKKAVHLAVPDEPVDMYAPETLTTLVNKTGRIEFYMEDLAEFGEAIGGYSLEGSWILREDDRRVYPLQFFIARHKYFMQGQFTNIPEMEALAHEQFGIALNPADAVSRGLKDGDAVEVFNQRGVMKSHVIVRDDIAPGVCLTWYSFDETYYPNNCTPQHLATPQNGPETAAPMFAKLGKIRKQNFIDLGFPKIEWVICGDDSPEVIFDQLVEVRKAE